MIHPMPHVTWAIAGGKGGVGKSVVTVSLAYWLGRLKKRVVIMDGDLGGPNLHTMLGIRIPERTLDDFILRKSPTLDHLLLKTTIPNVRLLAGGSDVPALANPNFGQKKRILRAMGAMDTDVLMVDLGAGTSLNTLDFFLACPDKVVVLTPQPTSIQNAYGFIKSAFFRAISRTLRDTSLRTMLDTTTLASDAGNGPQSVHEILEEVAICEPESLPAVREAIGSLKMSLIVNMVRHPRDAKVGDAVKHVAQNFLGLDIDVMGIVPYDPSLERWAAMMERNSLGKHAGNGEALKAIYGIAYKMVGRQEPERKAS